MNDEDTSLGDATEETSAEEAQVEDTGAAGQESAAEGAEETGTEKVADAAWRDVIDQLDGLAEAAGRWTRAAVDDPENRRRAKELRDHIEKMAQEVGDTIDDAVSDAKASDVGDAFKDAASKTGEAFKTAGAAFSNEVAPRMAAAFRGAADGMNRAAEKMERDAPPPPPPPGDAPAQAGPTDVASEDDASAGDA